MNDALAPTQLLARIRADYGYLFSHKERDNITELSLPHSTLGSSFVSVFVAEKDGAYIVSDFGWLADGMYFEEDMPGLDVAGMERIRPLFGVETRTSDGGHQHYYKRADNLANLSSVVFDVAQFIQLAVNVAYLVEEAEAD